MGLVAEAADTAEPEELLLVDLEVVHDYVNVLAVPAHAYETFCFEIMVGIGYKLCNKMQVEDKFGSDTSRKWPALLALVTSTRLFRDFGKYAFTDTNLQNSNAYHHGNHSQ